MTIQDIQRIIEIYLHTAMLDERGCPRKQEEIYNEVLSKFNEK